MKNLIRLRSIVLAILAMLALGDAALAQGTRLLRRPTVSRELGRVRIRRRPVGGVRAAAARRAG